MIAFAWWCGQERWTAVLSSLLGLAISGAVVWYVRIIGQWAMSKEAMGFGDVTLMAMIGAYLGWQAGVLVFFLAPLAAIGVSVVRLALWRDRSLPFGPYLCLTAVAVCVRWPPIWEYLAGLGEIAWVVPASLAGCMLCLGPLMYVARRASDAIVGRPEEPTGEPTDDGEPSTNSAAPAPGDDAPNAPPATIEADAEQRK